MNDEEENEDCEPEDNDDDEDWWEKEEKEFENEEVFSQTKPTKKRTPKIIETTFTPIPKSGGSALETFALAIQQHEGWFSPRSSHPKGSTSFRNNNPGNLKFVGQREAIGSDERGFAIFPDYDSGFRGLQTDIHIKLNRHPDWTFFDFFKVYAPASDDNNPLNYATVVSAQLGATSNTKIRDVV